MSPARTLKEKCEESKTVGIRPLIAQTFPPKPKFKVEEIPDLTGRVVIVTGTSLSRARSCVVPILFFFAILVYCPRGPGPMVDNRYNAVSHRFDTGEG